jgi:dihydroorotate dehydrogenase electron transfer subunit
MRLQQKLFSARVVATQQVAPDIHLLQINEPDVARWSTPGQFIMLRPGERTDPLLPRPFSICGAEGDRIELLIKVRGAGTAMIARWMPGQAIEGRGPLGNGFRVPPGIQAAYLVAGGIGIAPLLFLARRLRREQPATAVNLFMGAKTGEDLGLLERFALVGCSVAVATEDGSRGLCGRAPELLERDLSQHPARHTEACMIFGCGPMPMAYAVAALARRHGIACQLSLETRMACGVGACLGCVIGIKGRPVYDPYERVCVEGPVFDAREIDWERLDAGRDCCCARRGEG